VRAIVLFLLASAAFAQNGGSVSGKVYDDDGAAVAKAKIQVKNTATGATFSAESGANGNYTLGSLPEGAYELSANAPALVPFKQNVMLGARQSVSVDIRFHFDAQANTLGDRPGDLFDNPLSRKPPLTGPAPRMPDGKPDLSGVWLPAIPSDSGFAKPEPLPWAAAVIKERTDNSAKDNPSGHCLPLSVIMSTFVFPYQFVQTPKVLVMLYEGEFPRQIYLDGREHPKDPNPTWLGHSIGQWEGDTLVVDTVGFNGKIWLGFPGLPSSEMLHIRERYTRPDMGHLAVEITVDDPGAYVKPWKIKKASALAQGYELMEFICTEGERDLQHMAK
jgi:hypothetical protein